MTTIGGDLDADELTIAAQGRSITSIKSDITNINSSVTNINSEITNIKGKLNADWIAARIAEVSVLKVKAFSSTGSIVAGSAGYVMAPEIYLGTSGNAKKLSGAIQALVLSLSGNTYKLQAQYFNGNTGDIGTFSRATTLSCGWSSGKFTVNASPQGSSINTTLVQGTTSWNGTIATIPVQAYDSDNPNYTYNTGRSITVDALGAFKLTTVTLQGDAQSCFVEASSGGTNYYKAGTAITRYKAGTTTKTARGDSVTVTLQGDAQSCFVEASSGGTNYYKAGTAITRYKAGTTTKTAVGNPQYFIRHNKSDTVNTTYWYELTNSKPGSGKTYITRYFEGSSFTVQGSSESITPIDSNSKKHLLATTRYKAGSSASYYKGNGGDFTVQGASENITPIDSGSKKHLLATTRYKAGTANSNTYYIKK